MTTLDHRNWRKCTHSTNGRHYWGIWGDACEKDGQRCLYGCGIVRVSVSGRWKYRYLDRCEGCNAPWIDPGQGGTPEQTHEDWCPTASKPTTEIAQ